MSAGGAWLLCAGGEKIPPLEAGGRHVWCSHTVAQRAIPAPPSLVWGSCTKDVIPRYFCFSSPKWGSVLVHLLPAQVCCRTPARAAASIRGVRPHTATVLTWVWVVGGGLSHSAGGGALHRSLGGGVAL